MYDALDIGGAVTLACTYIDDAPGFIAHGRHILFITDEQLHAEIDALMIYEAARQRHERASASGASEAERQDL